MFEYAVKLSPCGREILWVYDSEDTVCGECISRLMWNKECQSISHPVKWGNVKTGFTWVHENQVLTLHTSFVTQLTLQRKKQKPSGWRLLFMVFSFPIFFDQLTKKQMLYVKTKASVTEVCGNCAMDVYIGRFRVGQRTPKRKVIYDWQHVRCWSVCTKDYPPAVQSWAICHSGIGSSLLSRWLRYQRVGNTYVMRTLGY